MRYYLSICLFCLTLATYAQNLIPDSSFENYKKCPFEIGQFNNLNEWRAPTVGTTDLFCDCQLKKTIVSVPDNRIGHQYARSGNCYAGFIVSDNGRSEYREYLQTGLVKKLDSGARYCVKFYLSVSDYSKYIVDYGIGAFFSENSFDSSTFYRLKVTPQLTNTIKLKNDNDKWTGLSWEYVANGKEGFVTIGAFKISKLRPNKRSFIPAKYKFGDSHFNCAYYFIDDVSIHEMKDGDICSCIEIPEKALVMVLPIASDSDVISSHNLQSKKFVLHFDTNLSNLGDSSIQMLKEIIDYLKPLNQYSLTIGGHTDNSGDENKNVELSGQRALSVSEYLVKSGIPSERIKYTGHGSSKPTGDNGTLQGKAMNRRVEVIVYM